MTDRAEACSTRSERNPNERRRAKKRLDPFLLPSIDSRYNEREGKRVRNQAFRSSSARRDPRLSLARSLSNLDPSGLPSSDFLTAAQDNPTRYGLLKLGPERLENYGDVTRWSSPPWACRVFRDLLGPIPLLSPLRPKARHELWKNGTEIVENRSTLRGNDWKRRQPSVLIDGTNCLIKTGLRKRIEWGSTSNPFSSAISLLVFSSRSDHDFHTLWEV